MEVKKSRDADLDRKRGQWFLLGLIAAFAMLFVALEWNTGDSDWTFFADDEDLEAEMELSPLKRDQDEVPMMIPQEKTIEKQQSEQLHLVENDVELPPEPQSVEEIKEPEKLAEEEQAQVIDMYDEPVDFRVVEDLPQFPGGASEFMKWLTKNLKYPASAQQQKVKGKVVAQFIVNTDGSVSDLEVVQHLNTACDNEVLRVLRMMPNWQAGVMNAKPCRTKVCIPIVFNM